MQTNLPGVLTSDWAKALVPGLLGLAGSLLTAAVAWAKDLNASAQRIRVLDEATKRALFWETWLKTLAASNVTEDMAAFQARLRGELMAAAKTVEDAFPKPATSVPTGPVAVADYQSSRASLGWFRRWRLLYKPARPRAWIPRVFFYFMVVETIAIPFILIDPEERQDWIYAVVGVSLMTFLFRALSVWAEKPRLLGQSS